jgi:hypothetical protein
MALGLTQRLTEMSKCKAVPLQAWSGSEGTLTIVPPRSSDLLIYSQEYKFVASVMNCMLFPTRVNVAGFRGPNSLWQNKRASPRYSIYSFSFYIQGSVHHEYRSIIIQHDATIYSLFISVNCSKCFGSYLHPSSGAHVTVSTVSGISVTKERE